MPEGSGLPLRRCGEDLRRLRITRRSDRLRLAACSGIGFALGALAGSLAWPARPALVWSNSASAPRGLYHVTAPTDIRAGDMVIAWAPRAARRLAAERRYLPGNVPLVKQVAAARRDRICAAGTAVYVNGLRVAMRRREDGKGRPLPWWTGCHRLREGQLLLLMPGAAMSFDGRYFGITHRHEVVGRARLLWAA